MNTLLWYFGGLLIVVIASGRPARDLPDAYDIEDINDALAEAGYGWAILTAVCAFAIVSLMVIAGGFWGLAQTAGALSVIASAFAWKIALLAGMLPPARIPISARLSLPEAPTCTCPPAPSPSPAP